eukprot:7384059-Prymnesium_polylepis.1
MRGGTREGHSRWGGTRLGRGGPTRRRTHVEECRSAERRERRARTGGAVAKVGKLFGGGAGGGA